MGRRNKKEGHPDHQEKKAHPVKEVQKVIQVPENKVKKGTKESREIKVI